LHLKLKIFLQPAGFLNKKLHFDGKLAWQTCPATFLSRLDRHTCPADMGIHEPSINKISLPLDVQLEHG
jgi:hypothetical protein